MSKTREHVLEWAYTLSQGVRSTHYLTQYVAGTIFLGRRPSPEQAKELTPQSEILKALWDLLRADARSIRDKAYRAPEKWIESPSDFASMSFKAVVDLFKVKRREKAGKVVDLPERTGLPELPRYYLQNFHFQTDGWLSDDSAAIYDHQVEVIFAGAAGAMRRQSLPLLNDYLRENNLLGKTAELQVLDLAAGTGTFSVELKRNFPDLHLTVSDLSPFYLRKAREKLARFARSDFVEANAETLPFKDAHFDVVVCVYLFHELPRRVREIVMKEIHRVLKPGGLFIFVDSIQLGDRPSFDPSLKYFPLHFHEPYYLDYISRPLLDFISPEQWQERETKLAFLSKIAAFEKKET
ncbi:MAG: class I SAM-dependent methyltransferase [Bdellovibrionota bacterium]